MTLRRFRLILAALAFVSLPGRADDALTQTTISVQSNDKAVAGLVFPIGAKVEISAIGNNVEERGDEVHFTGNVQGRITPPGGLPIVFYAEQIVIDNKPISAEYAKAVRDLESMAGPDQLYREWSAAGGPTPDEWKQQDAIDARNMKRLA